MTLGLPFLWYVYITYENNGTITFRSCSSLRHIFYFVKIASFICLMYLRSFTMLELRYILVRLNYIWKECYNYISFLFVIVTFFYYVTITLFISLM